MIQKYVQVGGLLTLFILTLTVSAPIVLTALQLGLIVAAALLVYRDFGDQIVGLINHMRGEQDVSAEATDAPRSGVQKRVQEPTVAAADGAATEGERDPA